MSTQGRYAKQFVKAPGPGTLNFLDGYVDTSADGYTIVSSTVPFATITFQSTGLYKVVANYPRKKIRSVSVVPNLQGTTDITWNTKGATGDTVYIQFKTGASAANLPVGAGFYLHITFQEGTG